MRRLVANLSGEAELAAWVGERSYRPPTRAALEAAAAVGTLMRAFAEEGDRLWLEAPLAPERLGDLPGLPFPRLESGPLEKLEPAEATLAWCETPAVAAMRRREELGKEKKPEGGDGEPLWQAVWRLPPAPPEVVARVHHRAFALETARELGVDLPGSRRVESLAELEAHLAGGGAAASPTGAWVVKAPLSAAGRLRWVGRGREIRDQKARASLANLFRAHAPLLFEPWMERTADFGAAGLVGPGGWRLSGLHGQRVDSQGRFVGIDLPAGLADDEARRLEEIAGEVARRLARHGYTGPFGIDAYRHLDAEGRPCFHPLGEINARMTVGLAAWAVVERLEVGVGRLTVGGGAPGAGGRVLVRPVTGGVGVFL